MKYKVCDRCGSHLDYGETCECVKEPEQEERTRNAENQKDQNRQVQNRGVSELAEALEEYRSGRPVLYFPCNAGGVCCEEDGSAHCGSRPYNPENPDAPCSAQSKKPEGVAVELADCMIRILDYCGHAGIDIEEAIRIKHEYNKTRPYRHGGKKC